VLALSALLLVHVNQNGVSPGQPATESDMDIVMSRIVKLKSAK
jgi:hypothetical protein